MFRSKGTGWAKVSYDWKLEGKEGGGRWNGDVFWGRSFWGRENHGKSSKEPHAGLSRIPLPVPASVVGFLLTAPGVP